MGFLDKVIGLEAKKEWKALEKRAKELPEDYHSAYKNMQKYMWTVGIGGEDWKADQVIYENLLDLLESAAAEGRKITDVIGEAVAKFCDELSPQDEKWRQKQRDKLNGKFK